MEQDEKCEGQKAALAELSWKNKDGVLLGSLGMEEK